MKLTSYTNYALRSLQLAALKSPDLVRVDDHNVVAAIDVRRVGGLVLALEAGRDEGCETSDDEAGGVDHNPLLLDLGRLGDVGFHEVVLLSDRQKG